MKKFSLTTACIVVILSGWLGMVGGAPALAQQNSRSVPLPSGRVIQVFQMGPMAFLNGKSPALMLKYQSQCKEGDKNGLVKEAGEVWTSFRHDVEKGSFSAGILSPVLSTKPLTGGLSESKSFNFVMQKDASGAWHALDHSNLEAADNLSLTFHDLLKKGDYRGAVDPLNKLIALWPDSSECRFDRGGCFLALKDYKNALPDCERAVTLLPKMPMAYVNRGVVYAETHKPELALNDFCKALSIDPNLSTAMTNRGELYFKTNKFAEAVKDLSAAVKANPKDGEAYFYRGKSYKQLGDAKAAETDFTQAKALGYKEGQDTVTIVK